MSKKRKVEEIKPVVKPDVPIVKSTPNVIEAYSGPAPLELDTSKLSRFYIITDPHPYKLKNAKFSSVLKWIDKVRGYFAKRGKYVSVAGLLYFIRNCGLESQDRKIKAGRRVISILRDEYEAERAKTQAMVTVSETRPKEEEGVAKVVKPKRKKDMFGNKEGTRAAKINAVISEKPHSAKWIQKKAKVGAVSSHLSSLVNAGFIIKIEKEGKLTRYRLKTDEEKKSSGTPKPKKSKGKKRKKAKGK